MLYPTDKMYASFYYNICGALAGTKKKSFIIPQCWIDLMTRCTKSRHSTMEVHLAPFVTGYSTLHIIVSQLFVFLHQSLYAINLWKNVYIFIHITSFVANEKIS